MNIKTDLRRSGDIASRQTDVGRPCDVAHPVCVALQCVLFRPSLRFLMEAPDLHKVVAPCACKTFDSCHRGCRLARETGLVWGNERAGEDGRRP